MPYLFFYISAATIWLLLLASTHFRPVKTANIVIGIITTVISLVYDTIFGGAFRLYHYIAPSVSIYYMALAGIFIYSPSNIIYTMFLPKSIYSSAVYTIMWIFIMMLFEFASVKTRTVVFTGWNPFPWSPLTYVATYLWVNLLYRHLTKNHSINQM